MLNTLNCPLITLEEHYWDEELITHFTGLDAGAPPAQRERLLDLGELRIREMDEAGIDIQVISHTAPSTQKLDKAIAVDLCKRVNDRLAAAVAKHPKRFAAFATLPTAQPEAAAKELERSVKQLGFKGAMIHGLPEGGFPDARRLWPIYAAAEALDVPIYLHPAIPHPEVIARYYNEYKDDFPMILRAAWGYTLEESTAAVRLILSGLFDAHPNLKMILGHLGEGLPFLLWRIDHALARPGNKPNTFRETFCKNFYVTTSGFFSDAALLCTLHTMGADRIMFSVDYPFEPNTEAPKWLERAPISDDDKVKIAGGNAQRLLRL
jgi:predicted TIM-barrel fold metal-dependent hydrolase